MPKLAALEGLAADPVSTGSRAVMRRVRGIIVKAAAHSFASAAPSPKYHDETNRVGRPLAVVNDSRGAGSVEAASPDVPTLMPPACPSTSHLPASPIGERWAKASADGQTRMAIESKTPVARADMTPPLLVAPHEEGESPTPP